MFQFLNVKYRVTWRNCRFVVHLFVVDLSASTSINDYHDEQMYTPHCYTLFDLMLRHLCALVD